MNPPSLLLMLCGTLLLSSCGDKETDTGPFGEADTDTDTDADTDTDTDSSELDQDGDGFSPADGDCDDGDVSVYPGAEDSDVDGIDQDCDGLDGPDADGDGYADAAAGGDDCDDDNPDAHPGAAASEAERCTIDADGDGFGDITLKAPLEPGTDCNDADDGEYPGAAAEAVDGECMRDADGDGFGDEDATSPYDPGTDCDDANDDTYPGAPEHLLGDLDCDGVVNTSLSAADHSFLGEGSGERAGWSVSNAGDVDGDGYDDILVGALRKAYLFLGHRIGATTTALSDADYIFESENPGDVAGMSAVGAGDVDGDGLDDILIAALGDTMNGRTSGSASLVLGSSLGKDATINLADADHTFVEEKTNNLTNWNVSGGGDVDGDGQDDILIGAYGNEDGGIEYGSVYLFLSSTLLGADPIIDVTTADHSFAREANGDFAATSPSFAGDVDGDGFDDILIGAYGNDSGGSDAGKAYLILASSLGTTATIDLADADHSFTGESSNSYAGAATSGAGDVDGDGLDDILIGAFANDDGSSAGKAYLILASSLGTTANISLSNADYSFVGESYADRLGASVSHAGDVDGDGLGDILIGAYGNNDGGSDSGKAYLILASSLGGKTTLDIDDADFSFVGESGGDAASADQISRGLSNAGDVNGDGLDDILVGAPYNDDADPDAGKAYLIISHL